MAIKTLSYAKWRELIHRADAGHADQTTVPNGFSPGGAAAELGVTRSAIHKAIKRGHLDAYHVPLPGGRAGYYLIPQAAIERYRRRPERKHGNPSYPEAAGRTIAT